MRRESLNITLSESLRRAQIRQRLDTLADRTALTATQIAGRALTIGLGLIEGDLRLIFPGQSASSAAIPCTIPASATPSSAPKDHEATPCAAMPSTEPQGPATASPRQPEMAERSDTPPRFVSTVDAARALGYREANALLEHSRRHPELRKLSKKQGRVRLWNLDKLRAAYQGQGWQPR